MNKAFYTLALLLSLSAAHAQVSHLGYFRQGEKLFRDNSYYEAAQYFEKYLTGKRSRLGAQPFAVEKKVIGQTHRNPRQEAIYHLAECYRELHDYTQAEKWYALASAFPAGAYPEEHYRYGLTLKANSKYAQAIDELTLFEKNYSTMGPILADADRELESLRFIQAQEGRTNKNGFQLVRQSNYGNTGAYALTIRGGDTLVFTSIHGIATTPGTRTGGPQYRNDLYQVTSADIGLLTDTTSPADTTVLAASQPISLAVTGDMHNGLAAFSADGSRMFFTRWTKTQGQTHAAIWSSRRTDTGWSKPAPLGLDINKPGHNSTQPFITVDGGYLLFSSDRPGGFGKYDLWYASLDSNFQVITVANLGETINTPGDDEAPFYHQNDRTLVFASNGRVGMGGFDIYYAQGNFNISRWSQPQNPGIPINSPKDDLYFVSTDEDNCWNTGWLSSDRGTGCCLAVYSIRQNNTQYIAGRVVDGSSGQPLAGVNVVLTDPRHNGRQLTQGTTDSMGKYNFVLRNTSRFELAAAKPDYQAGSGYFHLDMITGTDTLSTGDLPLRRIPSPAHEIAHSTIVGNFPYKKSALPASARSVLDSLTNLLKSDAALRLQVEGYTDGIGGDAYNIRLAKARVDACILYLVRKGIAPDRLVGKYFGKCCPLEPETIDGKDNPAGREANRRVEYRVLR